MAVSCRSGAGAQLGSGAPGCSQTSPGQGESGTTFTGGGPAGGSAGWWILCLHGGRFPADTTCWRHSHAPSWVLAGGHTRARPSTNRPGVRGWAGESGRLADAGEIPLDFHKSHAPGSTAIPSMRGGSGGRNRKSGSAGEMAGQSGSGRNGGRAGSAGRAGQAGSSDPETGVGAHNDPEARSHGGDHGAGPSGRGTQEIPETGDVPEQLPSPTFRTDGNLPQGSAGLDPPLAPGVAGADPSLSTYEHLISDLFERVRVACRSDPATRTLQDAQSQGQTSTRGLWWKGNRLYIPANNGALVEDLLYWHHDVPWCAHRGVNKTVELVKRQFWWKGMDKDIGSYVKSCIKCQANKPDRRVKRPPLTPLSPPGVAWKQLGVDLVVDLPKTTDGHNAICVFVCHLTKMVRLVPTQTTLDAKGFIRLFIREVFPHYGMPEVIVSDRGTQWNNDLFQGMCEALGIQLKMSTAYHPQTNGLVERQNEVVSAALRHYVAADHKDWDQYLPFVEFAINSSHHEALGCSPFSLNRIRVPTDPFQILTGLDECRSSLGHTMGVSQLAGNAGARTAIQAEEQYQHARRCVQIAKDQMKARHDKQALNLHLYRPGDQVWFSMRNVSLRHPSLRHKLVPKFIGPVDVLEVKGRSAVLLQLPAALHQIHPTVSVTCIKPYHPRSGCDAPPVLIEGLEEWEVEQITGHHKLKSRRKGGLNLVEFRAQWKGSYEDSWHELCDFEHSIQLVEHYLRNACSKSERKHILRLLTPTELKLLSKDLRAVAAN